MRTHVHFTSCPECGISIGTQGLGRHRSTRHDVKIERQSPKRVTKPRLTLEERLAKLGLS
jgi:hypothetical protein